MIRKLSLTIFLLVVGLSGCGTLDSQTNLLSIGDDQNAVLRVMGSPDMRQSNGQQEAWQYCKSGSSFGTNDHKDIMFVQSKIVAIDSYASHVTGCTNGIRSVSWRSAPAQVKQVAREEFSIEKAKAVCKEFGFKLGSEGMANCLLTQQARYDAETRKQEAADVEAQHMSQQEQAEVQRANQQREAAQLQAQGAFIQGMQKTNDNFYRQQMEQINASRPKPTTNTHCHDDGFGNLDCTSR